jgi:hypothetical protein
MSTNQRKPRIDEQGPGPLQRLKSLPWEELELLWSMQEQMSAARIIAHVKSRHGVVLSPQRLSDLWRWLGTQMALRNMNEDAETFRSQFMRENPAASMEEAHEQTLAWLHLKGVREDDERLMRFVLTELRKAREGSREDRKLALLEKKAEAAKELLTDVMLTPEERERKMREVFGLA